ncbi:MAG: CsgG/HfaB family protein [Desulfatiglans sp.]|nr:CsgG/HfaB family protein [Thermodesulfobacteriota bacterium]MEE4354399.1 CsgG/HfaB family protein [Desulfatiglans sp.]
MNLRRSIMGCLGFLLAVAMVTGCVTPGTKATVTSDPGGPSISEAQAVAYDGPKARIAVARFTDKTGKGWYTSRIGDGMADQLVTALFNTNRFIVLERQTLGDVLQEQDLGASGRVRQETAAAIGEIEGAELLIVAAVTEFEGRASGARGGIGGIGGGILGAITGGFKKAHMAIDMRIVDAKTSRIVAATSVEGEATDVNLGGLLGGFGGSGALVGGLGGWKNTPTEKALRICIKEAVNFIVSKTPPVYYRHGSPQGQPVSSSPPPAPSSSTGGGETVKVVPKSLNVRTGPGTNFSVVTSARGGENLTVLERSGEWLRVRTSSGKEGWVSSRFAR